MKIPSTAKGFLEIIASGRARWDVWFRPGGVSEFWLPGDADKYAVVTFEYKKLWVNLYDDNRDPYYFELSRITEDRPRYSWSQHINGKRWKKGEHMRLLHTLESMFYRDGGANK